MFVEENNASAPAPRRVLLVAGVCVAVLGLAAELVHGLTDTHNYDKLLFLFSLSYEQNIPTWYSSALLLVSGLALWRRAGGASSYQRHWQAMAVGLFLASLDESIEMHEQLGGLIGTSGLLYFDWVIPATATMILLAVLFIPFTRNLAPRTRRRFLLAGSLYLGGALLMELPLGYWTETYGPDNLGYALIDWVEESLEILGASVFLLAVLADERSA